MQRTGGKTSNIRPRLVASGVWAVALALALVCYGCDTFKGLGGPFDFGSLVVSTVTGGANIDPDGYQLRVESAVQVDVTEDIGANDTVEIVILPGDWTVTLNGIAANCSVDANLQVVLVRANGTGAVTFNVTCT